MFGYVVADRTSLSQEEQQRYQSCYCGLCRAIGRQFGNVQRIALNYDMTFLILLLSSLYEPEETCDVSRCIVHPVKPRMCWRNELTEYAASMNMALAYYNCMDNWRDDRSLAALAEAGVFRGSAREAAQRYSRQNHAVETCLSRLKEIERNNDPSPDAGANAFGGLMEELFVFSHDRWEPQLRQMGASLGRFIYLMDAVLDFPEDLKKGRYNPLRTVAEGKQREDFRPMLLMQMGECTEAFEQLPLVQDIGLLRNILYSGVWTRYEQKDRASDRRNSHV